MIHTDTPALWRAMRALPLACRFGAAPPELRARHAVAAHLSTPPHDRFLDDLHAALAALPGALKARVDPLLLGVFYMDGLGSCLVTDVVTAADGALVGSVVIIDEHALRDVRTERTSMRRAALQYLLTEAFDQVLASWRPALEA